jgi:hypothetical protein
MTLEDSWQSTHTEPAIFTEGPALATEVPEAVLSSIEGLFPSGPPTAAAQISSAAALVSGKPYSSLVVEFLNAQYTDTLPLQSAASAIIASDLGITQSAPAPTGSSSGSKGPSSASSSGFAAPTSGVQVMVNAVAAVAGIVGVALL